MDKKSKQPKRLIPSARDQTFPRWISYIGFILLALLIFGLIRDPANFLFSCGVTLSYILLFYSVLRIISCCCLVKSASGAWNSNSELPIITVLLPVYKEAHMIESLIHHVTQTHYPKDRLDIIIVCEPDDPATIEAAKNVKPPGIRTFVTNGSLPRTKPNALNQALTISIGEIITVYDAEDRPDPAQLHAAAHALSTNPELAVVQAPLTYYNANQNWLTRQFTLEYDALFRVWLPFLSRLNLPFPLGGTSNHIRRTGLDAVGGWDAHNVTEDADLSFRLAAYGWKLGYILPPTHEEAVSSWSQWVYQRTRWMKGYMYLLVAKPILLPVSFY